VEPCASRGPGRPARDAGKTACGGTFFLDLPVDRDSLYFEQKYLDLDGVHFDISHNGWVGIEK
jgi:hypothetical protein